MTFAKNVIENSLFTIAYRNCNSQFITTKRFERIALFNTYVNFVGVPKFWVGGTGRKIGLKRGKDPIPWA